MDRVKLRVPKRGRIRITQSKSRRSEHVTLAGRAGEEHFVTANGMRWRLP